MGDVTPPTEPSSLFAWILVVMFCPGLSVKSLLLQIPHLSIFAIWLRVVVVLKWMVSDRHEEKMFIDFASITALPDFPRRDFLD